MLSTMQYVPTTAIVKIDTNGRPSSSASDTTNSPASSEAAEDKMTQQQEAVADLSGVVAGSSTNQQTYSIDYLSQLLKDKKQLAAFPNVFHHLERLADEEISRVRVALFQFEFTKKDELQLPEAEGEAQVITEKVFVPAKEHPDYNFVGRILGPRGMTAKQLEQETGCKIMVRGRGSMRDKKKEEMNRGKPNWEHLSEELHVLIQCEDTPNRAKVKLIRAVDEVKKLLVPAPEGEDELKRKQLMELAIINGTYRSATQQQQQVAAQLAAAAAAGKAAGGIPTAVALQAAAVAAQARGQLAAGGLQQLQLQSQLRSPGLAGAPLIMSPSTAAAARGTATSSASMALQQQQAAAVQQAALLQQHQQAVDYQQLLLGYSNGQSYSQSLGYDGGLAAMQQLAAAGQGYGIGADYGTDFYKSMLGQAASAYQASQEAYAASSEGLAAAAAAAAGGAMLQRRVLDSTRSHPYKN
ncbi:hypothetical protein PMAYCL1PPCAC_22775 [Pristionchus mayeri]|uniref:K Homology domain-containing protein n=1 Tax=Pristionchus mayeri TaxID=1317129 RepID=A0AAN5CY32_9BILA|nr:hypothetical protein PMAYCL1PPCAC_22775 [Pristionchus mayeri]